MDDHIVGSGSEQPTIIEGEMIGLDAISFAGDENPRAGITVGQAVSEHAGASKPDAAEQGGGTVPGNMQILENTTVAQSHVHAPGAPSAQGAVANPDVAARAGERNGAARAAGEFKSHQIDGDIIVADDDAGPGRAIKICGEIVGA